MSALPEREAHLLRVADVDEAKGGGAVDLVAETDGHASSAELAGEAGEVGDEVSFARGVLLVRGGDGEHQRDCLRSVGAVADANPMLVRRLRAVVGIRWRRPQGGFQCPPRAGG